MRCRLALILAVVLCACTVVSRASDVKQPAGSQVRDRFEDYATIEGWCKGVPVWSFGNVMYVYGISPDLLPGVVMQQGNTRGVEKIRPKKSYEIKSDMVGTTDGDTYVRSMWNDDQPFLPIHLIDGDPESLWCSFGGVVPDERPEWIRIDLPAESTISSVALVCPKTGMPSNRGYNPGRQLPKHLTIKVSRDAWHWYTAYDNENFSGDSAGANVVEFKPVAAKQILVEGRNFRLMDGSWNQGYVFSIGELEVRNPAGENLALVSRGAAVAVSSTSHILSADRFLQDVMFVPTATDLGLKWLRTGTDNGILLWNYVEREKGKLQADPKADQAITDLHNAGVKVDLILDFKSNWLYNNPPGKTDWKRARVYETNNIYQNFSGWASDSPEQTEAYMRYVRYMVSHFRGRVAYWELGNECSYPIDFIKRQIETIRKIDPVTPIALSGTGGFYHYGPNKTTSPLGNLLAVLGYGTGGATIKDHNLVMKKSERTVAMVDGLKVNDATVSVDIKEPQSLAGIVIRAKDSKNYLVASYWALEKRMFFTEYANGERLAGSEYGSKMIDGLGPVRRITSTANGTQFSMTVSDGEKELTTTTTIGHYAEAGYVGLWHEVTNEQTFDNFKVTDSDGKVLFADSFDHADGRAPGWHIASGQWYDPNKKAELASKIAAVSWHVIFDPTHPELWPSYAQIIDQFKNDCSKLGYHGQYWASEIYDWSLYPPGPLSAKDPVVRAYPTDQYSDIEQAKYLARDIVFNNGLGVVAMQCDTYFGSCSVCGMSLTRVTQPADITTPQEPKPAYYVERTLSTVMNGFHSAQFPVNYTGKQRFDLARFKQDDGTVMAAIWFSGTASDSISEVKSDITFPGVTAKKVSVIDVMNGTEQELNFSVSAGDTLVKGMLIKDYPVVIRLAE